MIHKTTRAPQRSVPFKPVDSTKKHQPGLIRDLFERVSGACGGLARLPTALISGSLVGGFNGYKRGLDEGYAIEAQSMAKGLLACNAAQALTVSAGTGYLLFGPAGAIANATKDSVGLAVGLHLFVKGGSAAEMGRQIAADTESAMQPGQGPVVGLLRGAGAGAKSAGKSGLKTGFREGLGATSGLLEGLSELPNEFKSSRQPKVKGWRGTVKWLTGVASAAIAFPAALVAATVHRESPPPADTRVLMSAGSAAVAGAAVGSIAGPLGAALGASLGLLLGATGTATQKEFYQGIHQSVSRAEKDDACLGSNIANDRRDLVQRILVGTMAGTRLGWNSGVS
jgi:hypothetical protein